MPPPRPSFATLGATLLLAGTGAAQSQWAAVPFVPPMLGRDRTLMVYDDWRREMVVFGGFPGVALGDTALFDGEQWRHLPPGTAEPVARWNHAMAFDMVRGRVVMTGGVTATGSWPRDTWEWDGTSWRLVSTSGPLAYGSCIAFDLSANRTLLFGGLSNLLQPTDETWQWDGQRWLQLFPLHRPPANSACGMAYDVARQRTVMTGGAYAVGTWEWFGNDWHRAGAGYGFEPRLAYDFASATVVQFSGLTLSSWNGSSWGVIGSAPPSLSMPYNPAMAIDQHRRQIVLFGSFNQIAENTYAWNGSTFAPIGKVSPRPRKRAAAALDRTGSAVMFGGSPYTYGDSGTWTWRRGQWSLAHPLAAPPQRSGHAMAYDSARGVTVLFGGEVVPQPSDSTWEWDGVTWHEKKMPAPSGRHGAAMTYDPDRRVVWLFGGFVGASQTPVDETWSYDGTTWLQRTPSTRPPARGHAALAYDLSRHRCMLFGGTNVPTSQGATGDFWEWNGSVWTQLPGGPWPRHSALFVFDPTRNRCLLAGGIGFPAWPSDTWEWTGTTWLRIAGAAPILRAESASWFDRRTARIVAFGGKDSGDRVLGDMWSYGPDNPATATPFGTACTGTIGTPSLTAIQGELAWLADTMTVAVEPTPPNAPLLLAVGTSRTQFQGQSLPLPLDPIGMPGCALLTSVDLTFATTSVAARGEFQLPVPNDLNLVGLDFYCQAAIADSAANALGAVATNALACRVGAK